MTEKTKKEENTKGEEPKKKNVSYQLKRFNDAITAVAKTELLTTEEKTTLVELNRSLAMRYIGIGTSELNENVI